MSGTETEQTFTRDDCFFPMIISVSWNRNTENWNLWRFNSTLFSIVEFE